ncbi:hypothetical protein O3P69_006498 [Scylla paramamosain]|uniref:Uncharacterized protein n=1 Tax=Scylla paramamosain TaxID=85552 RepID=A0AAW0U493_SCYPA
MTDEARNGMMEGALPASQPPPCNSCCRCPSYRVSSRFQRYLICLKRNAADARSSTVWRAGHCLPIVPAGGSPTGNNNGRVIRSQGMKRPHEALSPVVARQQSLQVVVMVVVRASAKEVITLKRKEVMDENLKLSWTSGTFRNSSEDLRIQRVKKELQTPSQNLNVHRRAYAHMPHSTSFPRPSLEVCGVSQTHKQTRHGEPERLVPCAPATRSLSGDAVRCHDSGDGPRLLATPRVTTSEILISVCLDLSPVTYYGEGVESAHRISLCVCGLVVVTQSQAATQGNYVSFQP